MAVPISQEIYNNYSNNTINTGQINVSKPYSYFNYRIGNKFPNSYYAVVDKYFQVIRTDSSSILESKLIIRMNKNNNLKEGRKHLN